MKVLVTLAIIITFVTQANAQTKADFYVSPSGNDAWSGMLAEPNRGKTDGPFATPGKARDAVRAMKKDKPITVQFRDGRYRLRETLTFTHADSGTEKTPITYSAFPGEKPVFSGGIDNDPKGDGDDWTVKVPKTTELIRHISVDGEMRFPARWPKVGQYTIAGLAGADPKANYRTPADKFEFTNGQIDGSWKNLTDIEAVVLHFWVAGHYRIKSVEKNVVTLDRPSIRRFTEDGGGAKPGRYFLLNVPKLDPGEYHHDITNSVIRYRPKPGETLEKSVAVVPNLDCVLKIEGQSAKGEYVQHLNFVGLTFSDSRVTVGDKVAGDLQAASHVPGSIRLKAARHCSFKECTFKNLGGYGIDIGEGCRENTVARCELTRLGAGGIRINGGGATSPEHQRTGQITVSDNHIHHLGEVFPAGIGILSQHADHNTIIHNHIHHLYYTGISVGWVWGYAPSVSSGNLIEVNLIHDIGQKVLSDMGGIYMLGTSPDTIVRGNVMYDIESFGYGGWGIYTDEGSTGILIEKNLVYRTKSGGFHQHYGKENIVRNNIFALAREAQLMRSRAEMHRSFTFEKNLVYAKGTPLFAKNWTGDQFKIDSNIYWDTENADPAFPGGKLKDWQAKGHDKNSILIDPMFVDPAKGDFRLKPDSPAKKLGFEPFDISKAGVRMK